MKIQKLRKERAFLPEVVNWILILQLVENLGKLVWLADVSPHNSSSSHNGHTAVVTEKHSAVLYQGIHVLFLFLNTAW